MPLDINLRGVGWGLGVLHTHPLIVYPFTSYGKGLDRHEVSFLIRIYIASMSIFFSIALNYYSFNIYIYIERERGGGAKILRELLIS